MCYLVQDDTLLSSPLQRWQGTCQHQDSWSEPAVFAVGSWEDGHRNHDPTTDSWWLRTQMAFDDKKAQIMRTSYFFSCNIQNKSHLNINEVILVSNLADPKPWSFVPFRVRLFSPPPLSIFVPPPASPRGSHLKRAAVLVLCDGLNLLWRHGDEGHRTPTRVQLPGGKFEIFLQLQPSATLQALGKGIFTKIGCRRKSSHVFRVKSPPLPCLPKKTTHNFITSLKISLPTYFMAFSGVFGPFGAWKKKRWQPPQTATRIQICRLGPWGSSGHGCPRNACGNGWFG